MRGSVRGRPGNRPSYRDINLIKNAVEAMEGRGSIAISSCDQVNMDGRPFVEIKVSDSGPGIPEAVMRELFRPVTSAKGRGHAGLGLTIVKRLMDELGGSIACRSAPGGGTRFQLLLPRRLKE
jgi:signal transduction histidine kinase